MIWITEQITVTGIRISPEKWLELHEADGITAIVNLCSESQDDFGHPQPDAYLWLPVEDFTAMPVRTSHHSYTEEVSEWK